MFDVDAVRQPTEADGETVMRVRHTTQALVVVMKRHHLEPHVSAAAEKGTVCLCSLIRQLTIPFGIFGKNSEFQS